MSELFEKGAGVGTSNYFIIYSEPNVQRIKTETRLRITIIELSPTPKYTIEKSHNEVISVFDFPDGVYEIRNTTLLKSKKFQVSIEKVKKELGNEPALYTIKITAGDSAKRGGNSLRHVSRKRKSNRRRESNKKYSMGRRGRSRRVRRSRKN